MKRRTKRILVGVGVFVGVVVATPVVALMVTMAGDSPIQDGQTLGARGKVVKDGIVSAAVIDIGDGAVALIDCGNDPDAKALLAELGRRKLDADAVRAIFITHGHADHTGGCAKFKKADVYAMAAEKDLVEGRAKSKGPLPRMMPAKDVGARVGHALTDGEVIEVGAVSVTAFALPGHTPGSAVYLADGVLYFGDGASANKDGRITPAKWLFSEDVAQDRASLKALKSRLEPRSAEVKTLAFAHTGTLSGFDPLVKFAADN